MHDIRIFATEQPVEFPNCQRILKGYLATHLPNQKRLYIMRGSEVTHIFFARGYRSSYKQRVPIRPLQLGGKPDYVPGWPTHIEPGDDANDLDGNFRFQIFDFPLK